MITRHTTYTVECKICENNWTEFSLDAAKEAMMKHNRLFHPEQVGKETDENGNLYNAKNVPIEVQVV